MTRDLYEILGVDKNATPEEIKKSYRKLAQKWHPDKWSSKSIGEREKANEKMQELNKAYEVLGNEDKKRRYDLGETNFSYDTSENFDWDSYYASERAKLNNEAEKIRFQLEAVARREVINIIGFEFDIASGVFPSRLDSKLWEPYSRWGEKVLELEVFFTEDGRLDKVNSPLYKFQAEMIAAIRKRKEELKDGINNPQVDKARINAIESIKRELQNRNLKVEDLSVEYRNYQEHINSLPKVWQINSYRDKVKEYIRRNLEKKTSEDEFANLKQKFHTLPKNDEDWKKEKENLLTEIKELKELASSQKGSQENLTKKITGLEDVVRQLVKEIQELKTEIQEAKREGDNSPSALSFINQKEVELQVKQSRVQELNSIIDSNNNNNNNNKPFPIIPVVGVVGAVSLLGLVIFRLKKTKSR